MTMGGSYVPQDKIMDMRAVWDHHADLPHTSAAARAAVAVLADGICPYKGRHIKPYMYIYTKRRISVASKQSLCTEIISCNNRTIEFALALWSYRYVFSALLRVS